MKRSDGRSAVARSAYEIQEVVQDFEVVAITCRFWIVFGELLPHESRELLSFFYQGSHHPPNEMSKRMFFFSPPPICIPLSAHPPRVSLRVF